MNDEDPAQPRVGDLGLYIHVPYCRSRCSYCDFVTYVPGDRGFAAQGAETFAASVAAELRLLVNRFGALGPVDSLYLGGGTPTLLAPSQIVALIGHVETIIGFAPTAEITVEANPDTVDDAMVGALVAAGVTRLSVGMQSSDPGVLRVLGRTHDPERPLRVVEQARAAGIAQISLDLIFGAASETDASWQATLDVAVASEVDHVSAYGLIIEARTPLARSIASGAIAGPDDEVLARRYRQTDATLTDAGFGWYEVSNWARSAEAQCRHNRRYWAGGSWLAAGPGAWGQVGEVRWRVDPSPRCWQAAVEAGTLAWTETEYLDASTRRTESVMLAMRTADGMAVGDLDGRVVGELVQRGWVAVADGRAQLTLEGRLFADAAIAALLDGREDADDAATNPEAVRVPLRPRS